MECWNFTRLLPFIVGERVPVDNQTWAVLLQLLDVIEAVTAYEFSPGDIVFLQQLIEDFLTNFHELFEDATVKPKEHYGVHYGTQIKKIWSFDYMPNTPL